MTTTLPSKYNTPGGELYDPKRAFHGAGVFAPKAPAEMDPAALEALIDLLALFGFPEFTAEYLQGMKAGLPGVIRHAKQPSDWAKQENSRARCETPIAAHDERACHNG